MNIKIIQGDEAKKFNIVGYSYRKIEAFDVTEIRKMSNYTCFTSRVGFIAHYREYKAKNRPETIIIAPTLRELKIEILKIKQTWSK